MTRWMTSRERFGTGALGVCLVALVVLCLIVLFGCSTGGSGKPHGIAAPEPYRSAFTNCMRQAEASLGRKWSWDYCRVETVKADGAKAGWWYKMMDGQRAVAWCYDAHRIAMVNSPVGAPNAQWAYVLRHECQHAVLFASGIGGDQHSRYGVQQLGNKNAQGEPVCGFCASVVSPLEDPR